MKLFTNLNQSNFLKIFSLVLGREKQNRKFGFTLIELILYMGISSILLLGVTQIFNLIINSQIESETNSEVEQNVQYIFNRLGYDFQRASIIVSPANDGVTQNNVQISIDGEIFTYALNNDVLQLSDATSTEQLNNNATNVTDFSVQRLGNSNGTATVRITYTVASKATTNPETKTITTTYSARAL